MKLLGERFFPINCINKLKNIEWRIRRVLFPKLVRDYKLSVAWSSGFAKKSSFKLFLLQ